MRRSMLPAVLLLAGLAISACGPTAAEQPGSGMSSSTVLTSVPPAASAVETATQPAVATAAAPVTPMMAKLDLTGEPFAAEGDPKAPLTVVEFSDFG